MAQDARSFEAAGEDEFDRMIMIIHPGEIPSLIEALNGVIEYIEAWKRGMGMV